MTQGENEKRSPWVAIIIVLVGLGMIMTYSSFLTGSNTQINDTAQKSSPVKTYNYSGKEGKNALELLRENYPAEISEQGFVNSIDNILPAENQYWALYVNGKPAATGAKEVITKDTDNVEWKLEGF